MALKDPIPTLPTSFSTKWADSSVNNGANSSANKTAPTANHKSYGWSYPEQPPRNIMNWWQNAVYKWIDYIYKYFDMRMKVQADNFAYDRDNIAGLSLPILAGYIPSGSEQEYIAPTTLVLTANSTLHVYVDLGTTPTVTFAATLPTASSANTFFPLYYITTGASTITTIVDRRLPIAPRKATTAQAQDGTDNQYYITPATMVAGITQHVPTADTTTYGKVRLAANGDFLDSTTRAGNLDVITVDNLDDANLYADTVNTGVVILADNADLADSTSRTGNATHVLTVGNLADSHMLADNLYRGVNTVANNADVLAYRTNNTAVDASGNSILSKALIVGNIDDVATHSDSTYYGFSKRASNVNPGSTDTGYLTPVDLYSQRYLFIPSADTTGTGLAVTATYPYQAPTLQEDTLLLLHVQDFNILPGATFSPNGLAPKPIMLNGDTPLNYTLYDGQTLLLTYTVFGGGQWCLVNARDVYASATTTTDGVVQLATQSEAELGVNTTVVMTPERVTDWWEYQRDTTNEVIYTGSGQDIVLTHDLGVIPSIVSLFIKCTSSTDLGYAVNDVVPVPTSFMSRDPGDPFGWSTTVTSSAVNINIMWSGFQLNNKTGSGYGQAAANKWKFYAVVIK